MILTDLEILKEIENKNIIIEPFERSSLGTNSYDVHLGEWLSEYEFFPGTPYLDSKEENLLVHYRIPEEGYVLQPGRLYLGVTQEYTESHKHVPFLEGKSSVGRLGIDIHATAGKGDVGFCNYWTLEISCTVPVKVYPGMPVGQIIYFQVQGEIGMSYNNKSSAKYNAVDKKPVGSQMYKNF